MSGRFGVWRLADGTMRSRKIPVCLTGLSVILATGYAWLRGPQVVKIENTSNEVVDVDVDLTERVSVRGLLPGARRKVHLPSRPYRPSLDVVAVANGARVEVRGCGYIGGFPEVTHIQIAEGTRASCRRMRMAFFGH